MSSGRPYDALLLDAFGTLITVDAPAERLRDAVADQLDLDVTLEDAGRAFGAEMAHYVEYCHLGRDAESLAELYAECAAKVLDELGIDLDPHEAVSLLGPSIVYRAYPDTAELLRDVAALGLPVAIVSNADYTLPGMLAEAGVHLEHVFSSAAAGSSKPDPGIFLQALEALGVAPGRALHVGDTPGTDAAGALAAGTDVRILDRDGTYAAERIQTIASLGEILDLIE